MFVMAMSILAGVRDGAESAAAAGEIVLRLHEIRRAGESAHWRAGLA